MSYAIKIFIYQNYSFHHLKKKKKFFPMLKNLIISTRIDQVKIYSALSYTWSLFHNVIMLFFFFLEFVYLLTFFYIFLNYFSKKYLHLSQILKIKNKIK